MQALRVVSKRRTFFTLRTAAGPGLPVSSIPHSPNLENKVPIIVLSRTYSRLPYPHEHIPDILCSSVPFGFSVEAMSNILSNTVQIEVQTPSSTALTDITDRVRQAVQSSGCKEGLATIYSPHTTTAVIINEHEPRLVEDILKTYKKLVPPGRGYKHDRIDSNAHAHILSSLIGNARSIPISNSSLLLGTWQAIMFVELDGPRRRRVSIQIFGVNGVK